MYDLSIEPNDLPEVKSLIKQARAALHEASKLRNGNKVATLAKAFPSPKRKH
jgi:hypothetical protein